MMASLCLLKLMIWAERVLAVLAAGRELSWGFACPAHCSSSIGFPFLAGLLLGVLIGLALGFTLCLLLVRQLHPAPSASSPPPQRPAERQSASLRLRGYLHELWPGICCSGTHQRCSAIDCGHSIPSSFTQLYVRLSHFGLLDWGDCPGLRTGSSQWSSSRSILSHSGVGPFGTSFLVDKPYSSEIWSEWAWTGEPTDPCLQCRILGKILLGHSGRLCGWASFARLCGGPLGGLALTLQDALPGEQLHWPQSFHPSRGQVSDCARVAVHLGGWSVLPWSFLFGASSMATLKTSIRYATGGDPTLLLWSPPIEFMKSVVTPTCFFIPMAACDGGVLAAIPLGFLSDELLLDASVDGYDGVVGPSKEFEALLLEEDDAGFIVETDFVKKFLVVDLNDAVFDDLQEFDPVTNSTTPVVPFEDTMPTAIPRVTDSVSAVLEWVDSVTTGRIHFYSARDEPPKASPPKKAAAKKVTNAALVDQIAALAAQVALIQQQQQQPMAMHLEPRSLLPFLRESRCLGVTLLGGSPVSPRDWVPCKQLQKQQRVWQVLLHVQEHMQQEQLLQLLWRWPMQRISVWRSIKIQILYYRHCLLSRLPWRPWWLISLVVGTWCKIFQLAAEDPFLCHREASQGASGCKTTLPRDHQTISSRSSNNFSRGWTPRVWCQKLKRTFWHQEFLWPAIWKGMGATRMLEMQD